MRPIPPEIGAVYPSHPDAPIPDRPWWSIHAPRGDGCNWFFRRSDLQHAITGPRTDYSGRTPPLDGPCREHWMRSIVSIDVDHPMPHPGFRVGQVWAWAGPDGAAAGLVLRATAHAGVMRYGPLLVTARGVDIGGVMLPAWLLADPCCPWLAPWGPTCAG